MSSTSAAAILSQLKSLEMQIAALRIEVERLVEEEAKGAHTFADLKGVMAGQWNLSEEEIDSALYQLPPGFEDEIAATPKESAQ